MWLTPWGFGFETEANARQDGSKQRPTAAKDGPRLCQDRTVCERFDILQSFNLDHISSPSIHLLLHSLSLSFRIEDPIVYQGSHTQLANCLHEPCIHCQSLPHAT